MPVIDETPITRELKAFKEEIRKQVEAFEKRIAVLEKSAKPSGK